MPDNLKSFKEEDSDDMEESEDLDSSDQSDEEDYLNEEEHKQLTLKLKTQQEKMKSMMRNGKGRSSIGGGSSQAPKQYNNLTESVRRTSIAFNLIQERYFQKSSGRAAQQNYEDVDETLAKQYKVLHPVSRRGD